MTLKLFYVYEQKRKTMSTKRNEEKLI